MNPPDSDRLQRLEERFAFLERHVGEQDRAMLKMAERIDGLESRLRQLQERPERSPEADGPPEPPPPHY